jgi:hypothetical protein
LRRNLLVASSTLLAQAGKLFEARFLQPKRNWIADGRLASEADTSPEIKAFFRTCVHRP